MFSLERNQTDIEIENNSSSSIVKNTNSLPKRLQCPAPADCEGVSVVLISVRPGSPTVYLPQHMYCSNWNQRSSNGSNTAAISISINTLLSVF